MPNIHFIAKPARNRQRPHDQPRWENFRWYCWGKPYTPPTLCYDLSVFLLYLLLYLFMVGITNFVCPILRLGAFPGRWSDMSCLPITAIPPLWAFIIMEGRTVSVQNWSCFFYLRQNSWWWAVSSYSPTIVIRWFRPYSETPHREYLYLYCWVILVFLCSLSYPQLLCWCLLPVTIQQPFEHPLPILFPFEAGRQDRSGAFPIPSWRLNCIVLMVVFSGGWDSFVYLPSVVPALWLLPSWYLCRHPTHCWNPSPLCIVHSPVLILFQPIPTMLSLCIILTR